MAVLFFDITKRFLYLSVTLLKMPKTLTKFNKSSQTPRNINEQFGFSHSLFADCYYHVFQLSVTQIKPACAQS